MHTPEPLDASGDRSIHDGSVQQRAIAVRRDYFEAEGVNVSEWSRARGFNPQTVHLILHGKRPCTRGESHRIAVELGIKPAPAATLPPRTIDVPIEGFVA